MVAHAHASAHAASRQRFTRDLENCNGKRRQRFVRLGRQNRPRQPEHGRHLYRIHRPHTSNTSAVWASPTRSCMTRFPQEPIRSLPRARSFSAVGPLTASGVPLAGRTTLAHLSTFTKDHLVVDSHMGGMFGCEAEARRLGCTDYRGPVRQARFRQNHRRRHHH